MHRILKQALAVAVRWRILFYNHLTLLIRPRSSKAI
jgi:hypothetical protein